MVVPGVDIDGEGDDIALPDPSSKDSGGWSRTYAPYRREHSVPGFAFRAKAGNIIGGDSLDVTTGSPKERKDAAFDGKNRLPPSTMKKIKEGLVMASA